MIEVTINNGKVAESDSGEIQNATLQGNTEGVEFNIACYIDVPTELTDDVHRQDEVALYLHKLLKPLTKNHRITFIVQVFPGEDVDDDELVPW